jgi:hypothetical protein
MLYIGHMNSFEKPTGEYPADTNQEKPEVQNVDEADVSSKRPESVSAQNHQGKQEADAAKVVELREEILNPKIEKQEGENKTSIDVDPSLKTRGIEFTDSLRRVHGKLDAIDKESADIVSPGTLGKFRSATRNLEDSFQDGKLDLNETAVALNRLTGAFEDVSLINDRELRKITEDAKRSLIAAIADSKDSANSLRTVENMAQLSKNINRLVGKADEAAFRLRRSLR